MRVHGKEMTRRQLMEKLELAEPETIVTIGEWLCSALKKVEPIKEIECPKCGEEILV
jgi:hypothetical protein